ncbi:hypothetical protein [Catenulispora sp. GP43]|uniref:DUF6959 family protein n=1 Tax=Catenulispora sp. GP43 TaxID=3156263 RepID=UPI003518BC86
MSGIERVEADLFTDGGNNAVVRLPGRRFPGVLIQGDSLSGLRRDVVEIRDALRAGDTAEALEAAEFLVEDLDGLLLRYTDALERHGLRRPF